jgi:glycerol-3-phosphate acyltransferase PlsY
LLLGRWFLHEDIRDYGDGNPAHTTSSKQGGRKRVFSRYAWTSVRACLSFFWRIPCLT